MLTFNNFTTTVSFSDFSAENWDMLVKDGISAEHMPWNETEIQMLWNAHQGTSLLLKNYIDQVLNGAINHYNSALTTVYNRIATLEIEVMLSLSLDDSRTTRGECLGRTRWSSSLDWTTYLYYFYKWLYPTSPWLYVLLECSTITWPCYVIWLLKFLRYLYLVCIVQLDICN